jgi:toxin-antitoxin system PIN domain toxin
VTATLDANVLLHATNTESPQHQRARSFLEGLMDGPGLVYLFWPTILAYLRISTHPGVFQQPQSIDVARENVTDLLRRPHVRTLGEQERFWAELTDVLSDARPTGRLVPDAHLVALMRENGVRTIWTADRDFRRFRGIEVRDPFA